MIVLLALAGPVAPASAAQVLGLGWEARSGQPSDSIGVIVIGPGQGNQTVLSSFGPNSSAELAAQGLAVSADGTIYVGLLDMDYAFGSDSTNDSQILQIDPVTGEQTVYASGFSGVPFELAIQGDEVIGLGWESRSASPSDSIGVMRFGAGLGNQSVLSSFGSPPSSASPQGLTVAADGTIYVGVLDSDYVLGLDSTNDSRIVRIDPVTGEQTIFASGFSGVPFELAARGDEVIGLGRESGADADPIGVMRFGPGVGDQTVLTSFAAPPPNASPQGLAVAADGTIYVGLLDMDYAFGSDSTNDSQIVKIDPVTGAPTVLAEGFAGVPFELASPLVSVPGPSASLLIGVAGLLLAGRGTRARECLSLSIGESAPRETA